MPQYIDEANRQLAAENDLADYVRPTGPILLQALTTLGTRTAPGAEVTNSGGSGYAPQSLAGAMSAPANAEMLNANRAITFANMPQLVDPGVVALRTRSSDGSPRLLRYGPLAVNRATNLGDSLSIPVNQLRFTHGT